MAGVASLLHNGDVINSRYKVQYKLGVGSFGEIYMATDLALNRPVALKAEAMNTAHPQLMGEYNVYCSMPPRTEGQPVIHDLLKLTTCHVLVMELLGETLEVWFNRCGRHFSLKTVIMLAIQLLRRIQTLHEHGWIHRDIKPDNFIMGINKKAHNVFITDMGLCKCYRKENGTHIDYRENTRLIGTPRYASINSHKGREQSRRDDLESIGYMLVYFMGKRLPWQGLKAKTKADKYRQIMQKKVETTHQELCQGFPAEFETYLNYVKQLDFDALPNYKYLRTLFYDLYCREDFPNDTKYDWMRLPSYDPSAVPAPLDPPRQSTNKRRAPPNQGQLYDRNVARKQFPQQGIHAAQQQFAAVSDQIAQGGFMPAYAPTFGARPAQLMYGYGGQLPVPSPSANLMGPLSGIMSPRVDMSFNAFAVNASPIPMMPQMAMLQAEQNDSKIKVMQLVQAYEMLKADRDRWKSVSYAYDRYCTKLKNELSKAHTGQQQGGSTRGAASTSILTSGSRTHESSASGQNQRTVETSMPLEAHTSSQHSSYQKKKKHADVLLGPPTHTSGSDSQNEHSLRIDVSMHALDRKNSSEPTRKKGNEVPDTPGSMMMIPTDSPSNGTRADGSKLVVPGLMFSKVNASDHTHNRLPDVPHDTTSIMREIGHSSGLEQQ